MHFGMYLVDNGVITCEEFYEALKLHMHSRPQLGALAIQTRRLSFRQVFGILRSQCDSPNELFGELAISLGYLTHEDLTQLLAEQATRAKPFAQILVELEILRADQAEQHYNEYRQCLRGADRNEPAITA
jgi:hypothetical protein